VAHLRPRTNVIGAATRVRTRSRRRFIALRRERFFWVNTPIITASDGSAGALFRVSTLDFANLPPRRRARSISRRISSRAKRS